jgi:hypothetical protein
MNKIFIILCIFILFCVFIKKGNYIENFESNSLKFPVAISFIENGRIKSIKLLKKSEFLSPSFFRVSLVNTVNSENLKPAKIKWNNDYTFEILDPGSGYIVPPHVVFLPKKEYVDTKTKLNSQNTIGKKNKINKKNKLDLSITASGVWDDIPKNQKDELADITQDYLREQKYSDSLLENVYPLGITSKLSDLSYSIEWMFPIEFSGIKLYYNQSIKNVKLIKIRGYNENGVEIFNKELIYSPIIEWKYNALLKKLIIDSPQWDNCEIMARRVYWTCEEYSDFVEQIKESTDKPGKSSSKYEDDDTTILYSEVLQQIPADFKNLSKQEYIDYYSTMENHCHRKTKEQMDAEKLVEDQEIQVYQNQIKQQQEKISKYKEKLLKDYQMMVEQYEVDLENQKDAQKYGITAPEFKYSKKEIDDLKKRIESIQNIPEEQLLRDCSKLEKSYNKKRSKAEKWAKASIFLPFLKKKAKRESKRAEKDENKYQTNCAELVALSYSY